jgi:hypothetical protein
MDEYRERKYKIDELEEASANLAAAAQELRQAKRYERETERIDLDNFAKVEARLTHARSLTEQALREARGWNSKNITLESGKARFVDDLTWRIRDDVIRKYIPEMPAEWDGHHLRVMLADIFKSETNFDRCPAARRQITKSGFYMRVGRI